MGRKSFCSYKSTDSSDSNATTRDTFESLGLTPERFDEIGETVHLTADDLELSQRGYLQRQEFLKEDFPSEDLNEVDSEIQSEALERTGSLGIDVSAPTLAKKRTLPVRSWPPKRKATSS